MVRSRSFLIALGGCIGLLSPAMASETVSYTYDAQGRLIKVVKSGSVNNGVTSDYSHDKVGNRVNVKVTGAPN